MMECDRCHKPKDSSKLSEVCIQHPNGDGFNHFLCVDCVVGLTGIIGTFIRWPLDRPLSDFRLGAY